MKVNKKLIPLKMNFFLYLGAISGINGFLPTIAKQLGYSPTTYGVVMTILTVFTMFLGPVIGFIVDKWRVKKIIFLSVILLVGVMHFFFFFVPKLPMEPGASVECVASRIALVVNTENGMQQRTLNETIVSDENDDDLITCKLNCQDTNGEKKITTLSDQSGFSDLAMTNTLSIENFDYRNQIDVTLKLNNVVQIDNLHLFRLLSVQINGTPISSMTCQWDSKIFCRISCSDEAIMSLATPTTYRGDVINLYQFWIFFIVVVLCWSFMTSLHTLLNPICLELLGDKPEDFGKQKLWGSIGWGIFSMLVGWLVDRFSVDKNEIDYSPVFYSCMILTTLNLFVSIKTEVIETKKSKSLWKNIFKMLTKSYVITFLIWALFCQFFHSIVTHFLFWYMEDMVSEKIADGGNIRRIKTLQGLAQGVQCIGGEIPFFFWSGWIMNKMGYVNCMAFSLGAMALRMYFYTIISNPAWIIAIEILNGITFALAYAVKMSYAKIISPPDTIATFIGLMHVFDCIGESLGGIIGGYLFDVYGGLWSFRIFACGSAIMCLLNLLTNKIGLTINLTNKNFIAVPSKTNDKDNL